MTVLDTGYAYSWWMFAFEITMDRDKYKELKKEYENEIQQLNLKLAFKNFNNSTLGKCENALIK